MRWIWCVCGAVAVACSVAGCSPWVNIPPAQGDVASHNANTSTVRAVTTKAIAAVLESRPASGVVRVELPEGTTAQTYGAVLAELGPRAVSAQQEGVDAPSRLSVPAIRIRAGEAQVDVVGPYRPGEPKPVTTVYLSWQPFSGWGVDRLRAWRGGADDLLAPRPAEDSL